MPVMCQALGYRQLQTVVLPVIQHLGPRLYSGLRVAVGTGQAMIPVP